MVSMSEVSWSLGGVSLFFAILAAYGVLRKPAEPRMGPISLHAGGVGERAVARALESMGRVQALHDLYLTCRGRTVQVDHVVRCPERIVCIETKHWAGEIKTRDDGGDWTVTTPGGVSSRACPMRQNRWHLDALQSVLGCTVSGIVVMTCKNGHLVGRVPWGVYTLEQMPGALRDASQPSTDKRSMRFDKAAADGAWEQLKAWKSDTLGQAALAQKHARAMEHSRLKRNRKLPRYTLAVACVIASACSGAAGLALHGAAQPLPAAPALAMTPSSPDGQASLPQPALSAPSAAAAHHAARHIHHQ